MLRAVKTAKESATFLADIMAGASVNQHARLSAGSLLDRFDILAGLVSAGHSGSSVVTASFHRVSLLRPVLQGDLVHMEGRLVSVGRTSMTVEARAWRHDFATREFIPLQHAFITMVAVGEDLRPVREPIAALAPPSTEEERLARSAWLADRKRAREWTAQWQADKQTLSKCEPHRDSVARDMWLTPKQAKITLRKQFLPRNQNFAKGVVFGGDILLAFDEAVSYAASTFVGTRNVVSIAMNGINFLCPVMVRNPVEIEAQVVHVRRFTCEVLLRAFVVKDDGTRVPSHNASFTVLAFDESGFKRPIKVGLDVAGDERAQYRELRSLREYEYWRGAGQNVSPSWRPLLV